MSRAARFAVAISILAMTLSGPVAAVQAGSADVTSRYVVFAWNGPGMHCQAPACDQDAAHPPYNNLVAQVVLRGNPPKVVTTGLVVEYSILNNTYSSGKRKPGRFWSYFQKLFGEILPTDKGTDHADPKTLNGLAGRMAVKGTNFEAEGIPLTPSDDAGIWNPYQVAVVTVKNRKGTVLAETRTTIPTSYDINCGKCHGVDPFKDILQRHDRIHGTTLASQPPMLCSGCHADPAAKAAAS